MMDPEEQEGSALEFDVVRRIYARNGSDDHNGDGDGGGKSKSGDGGLSHGDVSGVITGAVKPASYDAVVPVAENDAIPPARNDGDGVFHHRVRVLISKVVSDLAYQPGNTALPWARRTS